MLSAAAALSLSIDSLPPHCPGRRVILPLSTGRQSARAPMILCPRPHPARAWLLVVGVRREGGKKRREAGQSSNENRVLSRCMR